ncbi:hypothetical protein CAPTEDRAFT_187421 [Capitella teleta]|uniref:Uncharacterized protein n=1 Tax=Capitella teleta TaxID=283909 RepID=R7TI21_CAPTE|nr:hypothetical protein CAPTEDRAFT_187421 [Capitella teleta]|eukprot:ELT90735.1 hypothetical protein CAPTEDRAFT_187421 [Capitella teleta]
MNIKVLYIDIVFGANETNTLRNARTTATDCQSSAQSGANIFTTNGFNKKVDKTFMKLGIYRRNEDVVAKHLLGFTYGEMINQIWSTCVPQTTRRDDKLNNPIGKAALLRDQNLRVVQTLLLCNALVSFGMSQKELLRNPMMATERVFPVFLCIKSSRMSCRSGLWQMPHSVSTLKPGGEWRPFYLVWVEIGAALKDGRLRL